MIGVHVALHAWLPPKKQRPSADLSILRIVLTGFPIWLLEELGIAYLHNYCHSRRKYLKLCQAVG